MADTMNCPHCGARVSPQIKNGEPHCPECDGLLQGLEAGRVPPGSAPEEAAKRRARDQQEGPPIGH